MGLNFQLALDDIKNFISPTSLSYLTSVVLRPSEDEKYSQRTIGERSTNWSESSSRVKSGTMSSPSGSGEISDINGSGEGSGGGDNLENLGYHRDEDGRSGVSKNVLTVSVPFVAGDEGKRTRTEVVGRRLNLSSLQRPVGITPAKDEALCSHLFPVCCKIQAKISPFPKTTKRGLAPDVKSVSEIAEKESSFTPNDNPYKALIGKISDTPPHKDFTKVPLTLEKANSASSKGGDGDSSGSCYGRRARGRTKKAAGVGVCDFSRPISNPMYKVYDPRGYIKSEDEVAKDFIENIGHQFNSWLTSLEGTPVHLDHQDLTRILREELELP